MDLRRHILALVAPAGLGDEVVPGARLIGASTELGPRLTFDVGGQDVHVEVEPISPTRPSAARSARLMFSYRSGSGEIHVDPRLGQALCRAIAKIAGPQEDRVLDALSRAAAEAAETRDGSTRIREVKVDRLLEPAGPRARRYYTLSPYVGCLIGCRFCYAQSRVGIARDLERLPVVPWGSYVDARVNAPEVLAKELAETAPRPLKFCPIVSDPYQAVEKRYGLTRACLEAIRDAPAAFPTLVLTRSRLVERDAELIASLPDGRGGVSIPTIDDAVRQHFEPRGSSVDDRLSALRTLRAAGAKTFAVVQPLLPGSIPALADALAATVSSVSIDVLHGVEGASDDFDDPAYAPSKESDWQIERAVELEAALVARGVSVWRGELPPDLA
ncbi:MAG: radical SAM protein [Byssovorax sp.]